MTNRFSGFEEWDTCRPWFFRALLGLLSCAGVIGAGIIGMECARWATEQQDWRDMTRDLSKEVPCTVVRGSEVEKEEYSDDCDGEPCPDRYRSWVGVSYDAQPDTSQPYPIVAKCYSHITTSYEQSLRVPQDFLKRYAHPNMTERCCIYPDPPFDRARFCDWDEREPEFEGSAFAVSIVLISVAVMYGAAYFLCKRFNGPCCNDDHTSPEAYEMGDNFSHISD
eukprot:TRINITY_DN16588_c0_g1_i1.p2 TRINITY_DN16588_c0_g1~~TRINITY_DN16588_c0_g1_i1.p2  ORF type:complete len:223 (+),score=66.27 TRINITY_DN16588_c0_g1_i1:272-940(+)